MPSHAQKQNLYCFVDETGQDAGSAIFIVVAVIVSADIETIRQQFLSLETGLKIGSKKWHKLRHQSRVEFINGCLRENQKGISIYFGRFQKPVPFFFPTLEVVQCALKKSSENQQVIVNIDGLDAISAKKMTNVLRTRHRRLKLVKGSKDESEVLIRLADRWAGALRLAFAEGSKEYKELVTRAVKKEILKEI